MESPVSLYRKHRPQRFADLMGQDVIRDTIFYAITHGQLSQAYLFCGPRGVGKTSTARLIAKVINCLSETDPKPCNTCAACQSIVDGANLDILELDAASNRGIDEIRQLRDTVRFAPTQATYKVFIIDEVHMLTREAFNALLKTLEEPPSHTVFILATTEAHKIPATIISRCQRYDFRQASLPHLTTLLLTIAKQEGMTLDQDGATFLAQLGDGSFRDALSLLEQVRGANKPVYNRETLEALFGYIPQEQLSGVLTAILEGDTATAHTMIDGLLARGLDLKAFGDQLLQLSQAVLEGVCLGDLGGLDANLKVAAQGQGLDGVLAWIDLLLEALHQIKQSPLPRLPLDVAIAKMGLRGQGTGIRGQGSGDGKEFELPTNKPANQQTSELTSQPAVHETVQVPVAVTVPSEISPDEWYQVLQELKKEAPSLVASLAHGKILGLDGSTLAFGVRFKVHSEKINQLKNREKIETVLNQVLNVPLHIHAEVVKDLPDEEVVDIAQVFELEG